MASFLSHPENPMRFRALKRAPAPAVGPTAEVVEPSAGTLSAFSNQVRLLPEIEPGTGKVPVYAFNMLKVLCCLHEDGKPVIAQLVNHLHESNPEKFTFSVEEGVSVRQTFDDLSQEQWSLIMDWLMDNFPGTLLNDLVALCDDVWGEPEVKN